MLLCCHCHNVAYRLLYTIVRPHRRLLPLLMRRCRAFMLLLILCHAPAVRHELILLLLDTMLRHATILRHIDAAIRTEHATSFAYAAMR